MGVQPLMSDVSSSIFGQTGSVGRHCARAEIPAPACDRRAGFMEISIFWIVAASSVLKAIEYWPDFILCVFTDIVTRPTFSGGPFTGRNALCPGFLRHDGQRQSRGGKRRPRPTDFFAGVAPAAGRLARRTQIGPSRLLGRHQKIWMWRAGYTARNSENCPLSLAFKALPSCRRDGGVPWVPGAGPLSFCWYRLR